MILTSPDGIQHECVKAVKVWEADKQRGFIELFDVNDDSIIKFWWIYDGTFAGYTLTGGNWSAPEPTPDQVNAANIEYIAMMADIDLEG